MDGLAGALMLARPFHFTFREAPDTINRMQLIPEFAASCQDVGTFDGHQ